MLEADPHSLFFLNPIFIAKDDILWYRISVFGSKRSSGSNSWAVSPHNFSLVPSLLPASSTWVEKRESLDAVQAQISNSQNISVLTNTVLATNSKHTTMQTDVEKVNSIPDRPRTTGKSLTRAMPGKEKHTYNTPNADYQALDVGALAKVVFHILLGRSDGDNQSQPSLFQLCSHIFITAHPRQSLH